MASGPVRAARRPSRAARAVLRQRSSPGAAAVTHRLRSLTGTTTAVPSCGCASLCHEGAGDRQHRRDVCHGRLERGGTLDSIQKGEAEALSGLIEARTLVPSPADKVRVRVGPARARMPRWPAVAAGRPLGSFRWASRHGSTLAEQAVLAVVATETAKRGDCRLAVGHIAAVAGVSETMVRNALREARQLGLVTVEERRQSRFRNDTNVVCVVSREWTAWPRLTRSSERGTTSRPSGGGYRSPQGTSTPVPYSVNLEERKPQKGCRRKGGGPIGAKQIEPQWIATNHVTMRP